MKYQIVGILICTLLITNVSAVLGAPAEQKTTTDKTETFVYETLSDQDGVNNVLFTSNADKETPCGHLIGPNLAPNPSFEEGDTLPIGWTYDPFSNGTYRWESTDPHSGEKSIGVLNLTTYGWEGVTWVSDFIPVDYMTYSYMLSGWFKFIGTPADQQYIFFHIKEYDENYRALGGGGYLYSYTPEWTRSQNDTTYMNPHVKYVKIGLGQEYYGTLVPNASVEVCFDDIYFGVWNTAPNTPTITGTTQGKIKTLYTFSFTTIDPDQDDVTYEIDWNDNTTQITGFYHSGEAANITHIWGIKGNYTIQARATDENGAHSDWATLSVTLPCVNTMPTNTLLAKLFERFPHAFPIVRHLMGY